MELDYEKLTNPSVQDKLARITDYLPLCLLPYAPRYFNRATEEAKQQHYKARTSLQCTNDPDLFMENELKKWLQTHPDFKDIWYDTSQ